MRLDYVRIKQPVRYSETDIDAKLSLTGIMNYMQDCSTMQSEDAGVGIGYLGREKKAWLLSSWQIVIGRRPVLGERIKVLTWPYAVKGLYALRNFAILDEKGEYLVKANSYWFLMNTETGRPMRITDADTDPYGEFNPKIEMETRDERSPCRRRWRDWTSGGHETSSGYKSPCK